MTPAFDNGQRILHNSTYKQKKDMPYSNSISQNTKGFPWV